MRLRIAASLGIAIAALSLPLVGCQPKSTSTTTTPETHDDHAHEDDHGHDDHAGHSHDEHGPHGGHMMGVEPGHRHIEWVHLDDEATIQVFVPDEPESVTEVAMTIEIEGSDPKVVPLTTAPDLGPGAYQVKSPELYTAIMMKEAAKVTIKLKSKDGEQTGRIEEHEHAH